MTILLTIAIWSISVDMVFDKITGIWAYALVFLLSAAELWLKLKEQTNKQANQRTKK